MVFKNYKNNQILFMNVPRNETENRRQICKKMTALHSQVLIHLLYDRGPSPMVVNAAIDILYEVYGSRSVNST